VDLGVLQLRLAHNPGVAFSLGDHLPAWTVVTATAVITAAIAGYAWKTAPTATTLTRLAWAGILAGATANLIDRAGDGVVTDYLHTGWWPTFNLADTFLVTGFVVIALLHTRSERRTDTPESVADQPSASTVADNPRSSSEAPRERRAT